MNASTVIHALIPNGSGPSVRPVRNKKGLLLRLAASVAVATIGDMCGG